MATITTAATQTDRHPYFLEDRKVSKFQSFIKPNNESLNDLAKQAREWRVEQGDKINVVGHAFSVQPTSDEEKRGPSSYDQVLTITYTENEDSSDTKGGGGEQTEEKQEPEPEDQGSHKEPQLSEEEMASKSDPMSPYWVSDKL